MKVVDRFKVAQINRMIDQLIVLQTEKLTTLVELKRSIAARMFDGRLNADDIEAIRKSFGKYKEGH